MGQGGPNEKAAWDVMLQCGPEDKAVLELSSCSGSRHSESEKRKENIIQQACTTHRHTHTNPPGGGKG